MSLDTEYASASASVREAAASTSDPESQYIRLDGTTSARMRGLLDVEHSVPPGQDATVVSATLYLYKAATWSGSATVTIEPLDASWDPYEVTWTSQPGVRAASATVVVPTAGAAGDEITVDITSLISSAVAADDSSATRWYGVRLSITATGQRLFYSPLGPEEYRPKLVREFSVPPDAPYDLMPDDGRRVSEVKPELRATFFDADADDTISQIKIQVDDVDTFASTHYDSGFVSHTEAAFDTNSPPGGAPAMTALTAGTTYYWRMKVKDNHGSESDYSETASFVVQAKGVLSLSAPGATVATSTPAITHGITTVTQTEVEVEIEHLEDGIWVPFWEVPRYASAATTHTVPDDYALEEGEEYRVTVRVWDQYDRADLPGDREFYEVSQEFTVDSST